MKERECLKTCAELNEMVTIRAAEYRHEMMCLLCHDDDLVRETLFTSAYVRVLRCRSKRLYSCVACRKGTADSVRRPHLVP